MRSRRREAGGRSQSNAVNIMLLKLGVFLPTYLLPGQRERHGDQIRRFAVHAEELGFDSLFATDHLLPASRFYRLSWPHPWVPLASPAAITQPCPLRQP